MEIGSGPRSCDINSLVEALLLIFSYVRYYESWLKCGDMDGRSVHGTGIVDGIMARKW